MRKTLVLLLIIAFSQGSASISIVPSGLTATVKNSVVSNKHFTPFMPLVISDNNSNSSTVTIRNPRSPVYPFSHKTPDIDQCPDYKELAYNNSMIHASLKDDAAAISSKNTEAEFSKTDSLERKFLAKYKELNYKFWEKCYSDSKCQYFGDCCPTIEQYRLDKTYKFYKCIKNGSSSSTGYLLITKCHPLISADSVVKEKCGKGSNYKYPPVMSNGDRRFYINEFCAKCNGELNFTKWIPEIVVYISDWFEEIALIRNLSDVVEFTMHYLQNIVFKIPVGMPKPWKCDMQYNFIDNCNVTGKMANIKPWKKVGCRSYTDPKGYYRNLFCKRCNEEPFCKGRDTSVDKKEASFGALMDLQALKKYEEYLKENEKKTFCQSDEFYDYTKERCRRIECSFGLFVELNSTCSHILMSAFDIRYKIHFSFIPEGDITELEAHLFELIISRITPGRHYSLQPLVTWKYRLKSQTDRKFPPLIQKILIYVYFQTKDTQETFVKMEKLIDNSMTKIADALFPKSFRIVKDLESLVISEDYLSGKPPNYSIYRYQNLTSVPFMFHKQAILYSEIRACVKVRLYPDEFTLNENRSDILIHVGQVRLTMNRVEFGSNDTSIICLSDYPGASPKIELPTTDFIEIILSKIFIGISLLCLVLTLTTYSVFSELRTLPGKCNIFLCCTLFVAQALFLFQFFDDKTACAVIGLVRHFAWLSTFGWMSVCSFHMYRVFTRLLVGNDQRPNRILVKYALTAYGLPLLIVASTVAANMSLYGIQVTGYGLPNCYLSKQLHLILAFALPLSLMVVFNISLLSITIYSLCRTSKECRIVNRDKRRVLVYLKLSSLTGITWIFGFISMSVSNKWVNYLFIVTNASQGVYIFLSYTLNTNVLKLFKERFHCFRNSSQVKINDSVFTTEVTSTA